MKVFAEKFELPNIVPAEFPFLAHAGSFSPRLQRQFSAAERALEPFDVEFRRVLPVLVKMLDRRGLCLCGCLRFS